MTVAPSMAAASSTLSVPSNFGTRPAAASPTGGGATNRLVKKPTAMTISRPVMTVSNVRWPRRSFTTSSSSDTTPVITPPVSSGRSKSR